MKTMLMTALLIAGTVHAQSWDEMVGKSQESVNDLAKHLNEKYKWNVSLSINKESLGGQKKFCAFEHYCDNGKTFLDGSIKYFIDKTVMNNLASYRAPKDLPKVWEEIYKIKKIVFSDGPKRVEFKDSTLAINVDWTSKRYEATPNGDIPDQEFYFSEMTKLVKK